jgi:hypothetical protein
MTVYYISTRESLIGKTEEQRPAGKLRHALGDNIKVDIRAVGCEGVIGFEMTQERVKCPAM